MIAATRQPHRMRKVLNSDISKPVLVGCLVSNYQPLREPDYPRTAKYVVPNTNHLGTGKARQSGADRPGFRDSEFTGIDRGNRGDIPKPVHFLTPAKTRRAARGVRLNTWDVGICQHMLVFANKWVFV